MAKISAPHELGQEKAYTEIKTFLGEMKKEADKQPAHKIKIEKEVWDPVKHTCTFKISASVKGLPASVSGVLTVNSSNVELDAEYSTVLALYKNDFEREFLAQAKKLLKRK